MTLAHIVNQSTDQDIDAAIARAGARFGVVGRFAALALNEIDPDARRAHLTAAASAIDRGLYRAQDDPIIRLVIQLLREIQRGKAAGQAAEDQQSADRLRIRGG